MIKEFKSLENLFQIIIQKALFNKIIIDERKERDEETDQDYSDGDDILSSTESE